MMGGQPFWRGSEAARMPLPPRAAEPIVPPSLDPELVIRVAAALWNVTEIELVSHRRATVLVAARALVVWVLRQVPARPISYPAIGRALGGRDHTTIMNAHLHAVRLRLIDDRFDACCRAMQLHFGLTQQENAHGQR